MNNKENTYSLADRVCKLAEFDAQQRDSNDHYPRQVGILRSHLKWMPDTSENRRYLLRILGEDYE